MALPLTRDPYRERSTVVGDGTFTADYPFAVSLVPAALAWTG